MAINDKSSFVKVDYKPDRTSKVPIYQQLIGYCRQNIISGNWTAGQRLPTQRALASEMKVNRSTVANAISELVLYGLLESDYGGGTRVAGKSGLFFLPDTPKWDKYMCAGTFYQNQDIVQILNQQDSNRKFIQLSAPNLSPEFFPVDIMKLALEKLPEKVGELNYPNPLGLFELRDVISKRLQKKGIMVKPSNILITSGSVQTFHLMSVSMFRSGADIFVEKPSYLNSLQVFQSANAQLIGIPMDKEGICPDKMLAYKSGMGKESSLLYTVANFQNPTGTVMSEKRRKELFEFCRARQLPIMEDDAYGELWFDEMPPRPIKSLDESGLVLYTGTVSMTLAPGFRVGWFVGPEAVVSRLSDVKMQLDYGASSISQWIVYEILKNPAYDDYLAGLRKRLKARRDFMQGLLEEYFSEIAVWQLPKGGFYFWVRFDRTISKSLFYNAVQNGLLFNPGIIYDNAHENALSLSYAFASNDEMQEGIRRLYELLTEG